MCLFYWREQLCRGWGCCYDKAKFVWNNQSDNKAEHEEDIVQVSLRKEKTGNFSGQYPVLTKTEKRPESGIAGRELAWKLYG